MENWPPVNPGLTSYSRPSAVQPLGSTSYAVPGAPETAARTAALVGAKEDARRGLDHGAWTVLHHLFPERDVPVFQLSLNRNASYADHYRLGQLLAGLRKRGVMVIGSGNATHNLQERMDDENAPAVDWAKAFSVQLAEAVETAPERLIDPETRLDHFRRAHPTVEHYLPILPVIGSRMDDEMVAWFHKGFQYGTLDMGCFMVA